MTSYEWLISNFMEEIEVCRSLLKENLSSSEQEKYLKRIAFYETQIGICKGKISSSQNEKRDPQHRRCYGPH